LAAKENIAKNPTSKRRLALARDGATQKKLLEN